MIVVGIDPSLTATGIAVVDTEDVLAEHITTTIVTKPTGQDLPARSQRLGYISSSVLGFVMAGDEPVDLVVIESPSLGQARQGGQLDRHGLWWDIVQTLLRNDFPLAAVTPAARAKYATGKGNAAKDAVLLAVARRYPHIDVENNNEADALILAAMGARHLGQPIDELPKAHLAALDAVAWPETAVA